MTGPRAARSCVSLLVAVALALTTASARATTGRMPAQAVAASAVNNAITSVRAALAPPAAADLVRLYQQTTQRVLWLDDTGRPTPAAREALDLLSDNGDGLPPDVYGATQLIADAASLHTAPPAAAAMFEVRLSAALLLFYRHLHMGRIDPRAVGLEIAGPRERHDFAAVVIAAASGRGARAIAQEMAPPYAQYRLLRAALARYRAIETTAAPSVIPATLRPGDTSDSVRAVRRLLATLGDLPDGAPDGGDLYDATLERAVRIFQERNGLDTDGVIGRATRAALSVPLTWRRRQIELAMERLRWLPDYSGGRVIAVNIPMFRLWAWDRPGHDSTPALSMKVVVGRVITQTPVFADQLEHVVFRPYWNVPASITRNEILPAIARAPGYLEEQNLEVVRGAGDDATVLAPTPQSLGEVGRNGVRLRQRPGPANALGLVKFIFPNTNNVYMHDTPSTQTFARSRRDFSHGCIRVEDPAALAEWVLTDLPGWGRDRVNAAMYGANNVRVDLPEPIQVIIFYTTAAVRPEDGLVYFADDIYSLDGVLDRALGAD